MADSPLSAEGAAAELNKSKAGLKHEVAGGLVELRHEHAKLLEDIRDKHGIAEEAVLEISKVYKDHEEMLEAVRSRRDDVGDSDGRGDTKELKNTPSLREVQKLHRIAMDEVVLKHKLNHALNHALDQAD